MLKKFLLTACVFSCALVSNLSASILGDNIQLYVGVVGGASAITGDTRGSNETTNIERHHGSFGSTNGLFGGVFGAQMNFYNCNDPCNDCCGGGFSDLFQGYFVGVQANVLYNGLDTHARRDTRSDGFEYRSRIKNDFQYGFDARLGVNICGVMPYILGGGEAACFQFRNRTHQPIVGAEDIDEHFRHSKTLWGPKVGVGVTFPITCSIYANMEYNYVWFGSLRRSHQNSSTQEFWHNRGNFDQNSFLVGLNYMF